MTDLPTRLHHHADIESAALAPQVSETAALLREAADEIERLRAIVRDHRRMIGANPPGANSTDPLFVEGLRS